ncbi:MAG: zf-TFIIB domain-containing protein, partial [Maioricimonas sp. JB049]
MNCPVCSIRLLRGSYEDVQLRACPQCRGMLVEKHNADVIKRRGTRTTDELKDEVLQRLQPDTTSQLACPRCRHMMRKSVVR